MEADKFKHTQSIAKNTPVLAKIISSTLQPLTEKIRTRSPFGRISPKILSIAISFDEAETMCSAMPYGSGSAFGKRYGLVDYIVRLGCSHPRRHILVANFSKLHKEVHQFFPLCGGNIRQTMRE